MLYKLMELSDLFADACVRDESGKLMFLSLYGRDTAIQQLLAAFTLKDANGGISEFRLSTVTEDGVETIERVEVGDPDRLTKFNGRLPKENLFGNLVHTWIYDEALLKPDRSNKTAWLMLDEAFTTSSRPRLIQGIWSLYKTLSPVPLLDGWSEVVLRATQGVCVSFMENSNYPPLGNVSAVRVSLPASFADDISSMIQARMIGLEKEEVVFLERARIASILAA
jgi:hypothetical protein